MPPLRDEELARYSGKRILVTGAGGYLGSALTRALAALASVDLLLLDQAEYGLYRLEQALAGRRPGTTRFVVGSVLDDHLLGDLFRQHAPEIVFHAAALKHVPLMESNPLAAATTNVLGTGTLAGLARQTGTDRFVLLSTDKAVDPVSIMGATKRLAEQVVLHAGEQGGGAYTVARLCNVLGSSGSVAPLFARQMASGKPLTLTHREATRFFLSRADAVRFLLRAGALPGSGGVVVPVLPQACRIQDLAAFLLREQLAHAGTSAMVETGLRPGDKLHEQLFSSTEVAAEGSRDGLVSVRTDFGRPELAQALFMLRDALDRRSEDRLLEAVCLAVPSFRKTSGSRGREGL